MAFQGRRNCQDGLGRPSYKGTSVAARCLTRRLAFRFGRHLETVGKPSVFQSGDGFFDVELIGIDSASGGLLVGVYVCCRYTRQRFECFTHYGGSADRSAHAGHFDDDGLQQRFVDGRTTCGRFRLRTARKQCQTDDSNRNSRHYYYLVENETCGNPNTGNDVLNPLIIDPSVRVKLDVKSGDLPISQSPHLPITRSIQGPATAP